MKITDIRTTLVNARLRNWVFVQVETDVPGLVGIGEATLEFQSRAVATAVGELAGLLIGRDPRDRTRLWRRPIGTPSSRVAR